MDVLLHDGVTAVPTFFTIHTNNPTLHTLPETCAGGLTIQNSVIILAAAARRPVDPFIGTASPSPRTPSQLSTAHPSSFILI
ncbi:MAG: hypothetical protein M5U34_12865 [Chloroflexi bacterium]|nr:hypothetical protein [Chloroflexota bacterium]